MISCDVRAYTGDCPFIFVSYSHTDAHLVYPIIERLVLDGYRVWYDDGIHAGEDWTEKVVERLDESRICIAMLSENYVASVNCRNEIAYSINNEKTLIGIKLTDFEMSKRMKFQLGNTLFLERSRYGETEFYERIGLSHGLSECRDNSIKISDGQLIAWREKWAKVSPINAARGDAEPYGVADGCSANKKSERNTEKTQNQEKNDSSNKVKPAFDSLPKKKKTPIFAIICGVLLAAALFAAFLFKDRIAVLLSDSSADTIHSFADSDESGLPFADSVTAGRSIALINNNQAFLSVDSDLNTLILSNRPYLWYLEQAPDGFYIHSNSSRKKIFDLWAASYLYGTVVHLFEKTGDPCQIWSFKEYGDGYIIISTQKPTWCLLFREKGAILGLVDMVSDNDIWRVVDEGDWMASYISSYSP